MSMMQRAFAAIVGLLALSILPSSPASAQAGKLVDPNMAAESDLTPLPHMTPDIVKAMIAKRPFKTVVELNQFLLEQKLTADQAKEFWGQFDKEIGKYVGQAETDRLKQYFFLPAS
jgi:hypothetical protein